MPQINFVLLKLLYAPLPQILTQNGVLLTPFVPCMDARVQLRDVLAIGSS